MKPDDILKRIHSTWLATRKQFRERMILIGSLIHQYLVQRLKEGDKLNEKDRITREISREKIIAKIADKLDVTNKRINEIMCVYLSTSLLSGIGKERIKDLRRISYGSLRRFRVLIRRVTSWRNVNRSYAGLKQTKEIIVPSQTEIWAIKKGMEDGAIELFKRAVLEEWSDERIRNEIYSFLRNNNRKYYCPAGHTDKLDKRLDKILGLLLSFDNPISIVNELRRRIIIQGDEELDNECSDALERIERNNRINAYQAMVERKEPLQLQSK